jgi:hypothetical protein
MAIEPKAKQPTKTAGFTQLESRALEENRSVALWQMGMKPR